MMQVGDRSLTIGQFRQTVEFVDMLSHYITPKAIDQLFSGDFSDTDNLFDILYEEAFKVLFECGFNSPNRLSHTDYVAKTFEETACAASLPYFITTKLSESFDMEEYHVEWSILAQMYTRTSVLAARGIGKSIFWSKALPLWRMWRYRKSTPTSPVSREIALCADGLLISNEYSLARELLSIIRKEIEENDLLRPRMYPKTQEGWGKDLIITGNGARLQVKSSGSRIRGLHPTYAIVDDLLDDSCLYSMDQNQKFINFFHSVIANAVSPDGPINVVGCVSGETVVATKNGLRQIKDIVDHHKKGLIPHVQGVYGKEGWDETSHFWCNGPTTTNKLKLEYGLELECSEIHPLWTMTDDGPQWVQSNDLKVGDWLAIRGGIHFEAQPIPIDYAPVHNKNLKFPTTVTEELAYFMGLWVAEGSSESCGRINITIGDKVMHDYLRNNTFGLVWRNWSTVEHTLSTQSVDFYNLLKSLGLCLGETALNKQVPSSIFNSTDKTLIRAFLRGLFDGDGCAHLTPDKTMSVSLASISETLIKQVQQLLWNHFGVLGGVSCANKLGISYRAVGKHLVWVWHTCGQRANQFMSRVGFFLDRKDTIHSTKVPVDVWIIGNQRENIQRIRKARLKPGVKFNPRLSSFGVRGTGCRRVYQEFIDQYNDSEAKTQAQQLIDSDIQWVKINSIEKGRCITYDFVIPKTNSFIGNGIVNHNTPLSDRDLYSNLRQNGEWRVFDYPLITPDGVIRTRRFTIDNIREKLNAQGSIIFSREILVRPITSNSTIFPRSLTKLAILNMDRFTLVHNIESFPVPMVRVGIGVDIAVSANVGADFFVIVVVGKDDLGRYWLLHMTRAKGWSLGQQLAALKRVNRDFGGTMVIESNAAQMFLIDAAVADGLYPVADPTTASNKYDPKNGLVGLSVLFERNLMKFPYGDEFSRNTVDLILDELGSITFTDKGLKGVGAHDDTTMALHKAIKACNYLGGQFKADFF